jgi:uncharacterized protein involved in exopolysaccharide biosynthesis
LVLALTTLVALLGAILYLATATPIYRATAILATGYGATATGKVPPDEFLAAQRALIRSPQVLAAGARAAPQVPDLVSADGKAASALRVHTSSGDGTIMLSVEAPDAAQAADAVNAIAEAYLEARSGPHALAANALKELTRQRDARSSQRETAQKALGEFRAAAGASGGDAQKAADERIKQLRVALDAAKAEVATAKAAADAARSISYDSKQIADLVQAHRASGIFAGLDQQRNAIADELRRAESDLERQRQTMLPQHPTVVATENRIAQLKAKRDALDPKYLLVYHEHLDKQHVAAQSKVAEVEKLLAEQRKVAQDSTASAARLAELEAALKQADAALADADAKLLAAMLNADTVGADVKIAQPALPSRRPVHPDRARVLLLALGCGLLVGLAIITVRSVVR